MLIGISKGATSHTATTEVDLIKRTLFHDGPSRATPLPEGKPARQTEMRFVYLHLPSLTVTTTIRAGSQRCAAALLTNLQGGKVSGTPTGSLLPDVFSSGATEQKDHSSNCIYSNYTYDLGNAHSNLNSHSNPTYHWTSVSSTLTRGPPWI